MNTVNLPLALFTVVLRRFIDKLRLSQSAVVLKHNPWFLDASLFKLCFYAYMFSTGLYYTLKHMRKGTIVSLAQKCSTGAVSIKDRCMRRKWPEREKRPWLMRNLTRNRESQQRALGYVASLLPHEMTNSCSHPLITDDDNTSNFNHPQENPFAPNPHFEPKVCYNRPVFNRLPAPPPQIRNTNRTGSPCINITDESFCDNIPARRAKRKKRAPQRIRNYLALRNRKINKTQLKGGEKTVRKTRSGKVYGYHTTTKSRIKK